jgi:hypothetical protein
MKSTAVAAATTAEGYVTTDSSSANNLATVLQPGTTAV